MRRLLTLLCLLPLLAWAQLNADQAARLAREATGGRILNVQPVDAARYRVRVLLPDGTVRTVTVRDDGSVR